MLILSRQVGERIMIGDGIVVTVLDLRPGKVRLGIDAPREVPVHREELLRRASPPAPPGAGDGKPPWED